MATVSSEAFVAFVNETLLQKGFQLHGQLERGAFGHAVEQVVGQTVGQRFAIDPFQELAARVQGVPATHHDRGVVHPRRGGFPCRPAAS